jgi:hypothetical protein
MPETSIVKKIYKWKPFTRRPVGRPKSRWEDEVRKDLKKMKRIKWTGQSKIALNGRVLLRRPSLFHSSSAEEEEGGGGGGEGEEKEGEEGGGEEDAHSLNVCCDLSRKSVNVSSQ